MLGVWVAEAVPVPLGVWLGVGLQTLFCAVSARPGYEPSCADADHDTPPLDDTSTADTPPNGPRGATVGALPPWT